VGPADQGHVPKRETQKIYFQKVAISSTAEKCPSTHHNSPQIHHNFTRFLPSRNTQKSQNPLQKRTSTTQKNIPLTSTQKLLH
jgi:hypothetical protein